MVLDVQRQQQVSLLWGPKVALLGLVSLPARRSRCFCRCFLPPYAPFSFDISFYCSNPFLVGQIRVPVPYVLTQSLLSCEPFLADLAFIVCWIGYRFLGLSEHLETVLSIDIRVTELWSISVYLSAPTSYSPFAFSIVDGNPVPFQEFLPAFSAFEWHCTHMLALNLCFDTLEVTEELSACYTPRSCKWYLVVYVPDTSVISIQSGSLWGAPSSSVVRETGPKGPFSQSMIVRSLDLAPLMKMKPRAEISIVGRISIFNSSMGISTLRLSILKESTFGPWLLGRLAPSELTLDMTGLRAATAA